MCAGSTYVGGTSGGSITSGDPSNNTSGGPSNNTSGGTALTTYNLPVEVVLRTADGTNGSGSTTGWDKTVAAGTWSSHRINDGKNAGWGLAHTHTLSSHTHTLSSHTHDTIPPYIALYVWERTA